MIDGGRRVRQPAGRSTMAADSAIRDRLNAWLLDALDGRMHATYGGLKARLLGAVPPVVVEIGPGSGANLRYYPPGTRVVAIEPNARMHRRLRRRAARLGLRLEIHPVGAESLDLPDRSVDLVCATFVLCSVSDPAAVVAEVRRVLRPGGRFVVVEHVAAPPASRAAALQRALRRPWRWTFGGCDLCRRTEEVLRAAGFRSVSVETLDVGRMPLPVRDQIAATCTA
jgi:SAM-dependent methyltransferase